MQNFELYIEPERPQRNRKTGRFMVGHVPFNKGMKWNDFIPSEKQRTIIDAAIKAFGSCKKGSYKRSVVMIDGDRYKVFESAVDAWRKTGISRSNINRCCRHISTYAGGYKWFYEEDNQWCNLINNTKEEQ